MRRGIHLDTLAQVVQKLELAELGAGDRWNGSTTAVTPAWQVQVGQTRDVDAAAGEVTEVKGGGDRREEGKGGRRGVAEESGGGRHRRDGLTSVKRWLRGEGSDDDDDGGRDGGWLDSFVRSKLLQASSHLVDLYTCAHKSALGYKMLARTEKKKSKEPSPGVSASTP